MLSFAVRSKFMEADKVITVTLVAALRARSVREMSLPVLSGSTVAQALQRSGFLDDVPEDDIAGLELGVWGRKVASSYALREGDRIELTRALTVDPKVARRERFARQGAKKAGLFKTRRDGAGAGY